MDDPLSAAWGLTFVIGINSMSVEESAEVAVQLVLLLCGTSHEFLWQYFDVYRKIPFEIYFSVI
ncbi:hypothetical protein HMPREF9374_1386 [Desmospora sp. 8437]|nr:hypothetical protein HMPREF9374_1386 [Desmospora sp. 8437]